jgi:hypothetical protein
MARAHVVLGIAESRLLESTGDAVGAAESWSRTLVDAAAVDAVDLVTAAMVAPLAPWAGAPRRRARFGGVPILRTSPTRRYPVAIGSPYTIASAPTKLHRLCRHRAAIVTVPSYSLPAPSTCPGIIGDAESYRRAVASFSEVAESHEISTYRYVCPDCYAVDMTDRYPSALAAHDARFDVIAAATRAWSRAVGLIGVARHDGIAQAVAAGIVRDLGVVERATWRDAPSVADAVDSTPHEVRPLIATWAAAAWDIVRAISGGLSRQVECADCVAESIYVRWHMSGDIYSAAYADMLRLVIWESLLTYYETLRLWNPSRLWHDAVPPRLKAAVDRLVAWCAESHDGRAVMVASGIAVDVPVPESVATAWRSLSAVASHVDALAAGGPLASYGAPCHAQAESPAHICGECARCYVPLARVPYLLH